MVSGVADEAAPLDLDDVFRRHSRYVAAIGLRTLGRDGEVDDFVQDVFIEVHRRLDTVRDSAAIKGWLATIAVRTAKRRLRRRRLRRWLSLDDDADYRELADDRATPEQQALLARVYEILDGLPVNHRLAWVLRNLAGHKLEDIASYCGCSVATVKRHITRAKRAIDKAVADE